jgi:hypothetical protein
MGKWPTRKTPKGPLQPPIDAVPLRPGPPAPLRRQLRAVNGVELWQVEELRKQDPRTPIIRYMVVRGGSEASFNRPQEAWRYFQGLSAPDKDLRPERPPIDEAFLEHPSKRTIRGRRRAPGPK